jgi:glycosylphosphatidylinositol transamidase
MGRADDRRSNYLQETFSHVGLNSGNTSLSTYAHIQPPRSPGTETIILSANWVSRDGTPNLRGVASALALGDFLKGRFHAGVELTAGQNYWAFDIVIVIGEGYLEGLENFMQSYHSLFSGIVWTALNIDYPGHSFSHLGLFYGKLTL